MTAPVAPAISRQIAGTADRSSALWDFSFIVIASEPFGLPPHPSRLRRTAFPSEGKAFFGALNPVRQGTVLCLPSDTKPSPVCCLFHRTAQSEREKRNPVFQFMELKNTISLLSSLFTLHSNYSPHFASSRWRSSRRSLETRESASICLPFPESRQRTVR